MEAQKKFKLNKKFKQKWVNALRSGKYKQTAGALYDGDGYCCLGVACKVAGIDENNLCGNSYIDKNFASQAKNKSDAAALKAIDANHEQFGESNEFSIQDKLAAFNDSKRLSFKWIASYIEKNL